MNERVMTESRTPSPPTVHAARPRRQLVELERLQQALAEAEERAKNHWDQYLRAVAELENMRKRAQRDVEQAHRYGAREARPGAAARARTAWSWPWRMPHAPMPQAWPQGRKPR